MAKSARVLESLADGPARDNQEALFRSLQQKEKRASEQFNQLNEEVEQAVQQLKMVRQRAAVRMLVRALGIATEKIRAAVLEGELPHSRSARPTNVVITLLLVAMDIIKNTPHGGGCSESPIAAAMTKILLPLTDEPEIRSVLDTHGWDEDGFAAPPASLELSNDLFGAIGRRLWLICGRWVSRRWNQPLRQR